MSNMRSALARYRTRILGLTLTLAALALVLLLPGTSEATKCGLEFYYYSDPGLTNLIGVRGYFPTECGCGSYGWGATSSYREILDGTC